MIVTTFDAYEFREQEVDGCKFIGGEINTGHHELGLSASIKPGRLSVLVVYHIDNNFRSTVIKLDAKLMEELADKKTVYFLLAFLLATLEDGAPPPVVTKDLLDRVIPPDERDTIPFSQTTEPDIDMDAAARKMLGEKRTWN